MTIALWTATNAAHWDARARAHLLGGKDYYDLAGVLSGRSSLRPVELALAGEVSGRRVLHLMCHIGLDSISWARLGAHVTAVDLSPESIVAARRLACASKVDVDFHAADINALPADCDGPFDMIVMSYGVICWLRDFHVLAHSVAERLQRGGRFVLVDGHPVTNLWPHKSFVDGWRPREDSYFTKHLPDQCETQVSYGSSVTLASATSYQWQHHVSDIVQGLVNAGLHLRIIREEPYSFYRRYPGMTLRPDGYLDPPPGMHGLPMLFALMAERT